MQAIVVIEAGVGQVAGIVEKLKKMGDQITALAIDLLVGGQYQIMVRVEIEDEAETMAVEGHIRTISGVQNLDIWTCQEVTVSR